MLVSNGAAFRELYPGVEVTGQFSRNLSNAGDTVQIRGPDGEIVTSVTYDDVWPWPVGADGSGHSLVVVDPNPVGEPNDPSHWRLSRAPGGSPGTDDEFPEPTPPRILEHPHDATVREGERATFMVAAHGRPSPAYRWQRDGVDITGALADSYTTHPVAAVDNGAVFRCVATNAQGSVTSGGATLTVLPGERSFIRGDANGDGKPDVADAVQVLALLLSGARTSCLDASDANDDGKIDIADAIALLGHLFGGGGDLPQPSGGCGVDPTGDDLGCESFAPCKEPPTSKRSLAMPVVVYSFAAPYFSDSSNSPSVVR